MNARYLELSKLNKSNFLNALAMVQDIKRLQSPIKSVLNIGIGEGLIETILKQSGFDVVCADYDPTKYPDLVLDIKDLSTIPSNTFDLVIASHVVEHVPFGYFEDIVSNISRISSSTLLYLPIRGRLPTVHVDLDVRDLTFAFDKWMRLPFNASDDTPLLCDGQHYWEIGCKHQSKKAITSLLERYFVIVDAYHNKNWKRSFNFVLKSC